MSAKTTNRQDQHDRNQQDRNQQRAGRQEWRRSSHSNGSGACVEVAPTPDGGASIRDSRNPQGAVLTFQANEWRAFLDGARDGEFHRMS
ncbi:DUF397 domain-containing protein [Streptacidiphilus sp. ASG 303]|uniref:DUF397 domain-containing protein n=1 Tax=Streptomycetaceae TaxID=2062 RepID=UPI001E638698|nr:DUF397 domain-containing protein [Streptacidiphilus sp. ASG 303]MCD0482935.1 DUF397 domain-containing protein [Streptacidiphilus sp. ASG 303]